jgi:hypothetical protein
MTVYLFDNSCKLRVVDDIYAHSYFCRLCNLTENSLKYIRSTKNKTLERKTYMSFEVFTAEKMSMLVFWVMMSCGLVGGYQRSAKIA